MFNKEQLELLDALFNEDDFAQRNQLDDKTVSALRGACHSLLWTTTKPVPRRDQDAIKAAEREGRVQVFGPPATVAAIQASRLRPEVLKVKTGDALLAALHLRSIPKKDDKKEEAA